MSTTTLKSSSNPTYDHEYFEKLHASHVDPWSVLTSAYEREKFRATLDALEKPVYGHILELGCSIGGLTNYLSSRCKALTAVDTSGTALARAREWCPQPHVRFVQAHLPDGHWQGSYDLVVLSEVLYYFTIPALVRLADRLSRFVMPETRFVVVHWTGETNYPLSGDRAMELFQCLVRARRVHHERHPCYRIETWALEPDERNGIDA